jgi:PAS domain-containing protein
MPDAVLRVVADSSPHPIAIVGADGALLLANRALRILVDEDALEDAVGHSWVAPPPADDRADQDRRRGRS